MSYSGESEDERMTMETQQHPQPPTIAQSRHEHHDAVGYEVNQTTTFALAIPPDEVEAVRGFVAELLGPRRNEFEESWKDKGITRETASLQVMSQGALVLVSMEAHDLGRAFRELASSDTPFDRWYRDTVLRLYGVDLSAGIRPPSELLADWRAP